MKKFIEGVWSCFVLAFWFQVWFWGSLLGLVIWPEMVAEYAAGGIALTPNEMLGMGMLLIGFWPLAGMTGIWMHLSAKRVRPQGL